MKNSLLIVAVLGLAFASCKKDRVCSCETVTSYTGTWTGTPADKPADSVEKEDYTLVKSGLLPARRACIHTKTSSPYADINGSGLTENVDMNCSLK